MFAARTQFPARTLSSGRSARFHRDVRRPYWYGVVTSDSGSLMSVAWRPISPVPNSLPADRLVRRGRGDLGKVDPLHYRRDNRTVFNLRTTARADVLIPLMLF